MWRWLIVLVVAATILATSVAAYEWQQRPKSLATAKQAWGRAGIENYTLDIAVDGCMACGEPLRYSAVVTNGEKTSETDPPGQKPGYAPTVEDLFRMIEASGPSGSTVTYNDAGVPTEMHFDDPDVADDQAHYTVTITET
jgi:Family of unknown function (DUF6174)